MSKVPHGSSPTQSILKSHFKLMESRMMGNYHVRFGKGHIPKKDVSSSSQNE